MALIEDAKTKTKTAREGYDRRIDRHTQTQTNKQTVTHITLLLCRKHALWMLVMQILGHGWSQLLTLVLELVLFIKTYTEVILM